MPIKLVITEPKSADYIYIDEHNKVHLLMPVVSGYIIGIDNAPIHGHDQSLLVLAVLQDYKQKLDADIAVLTKTGTFKALEAIKIERKTQIDLYIRLLTRYQNHFVNSSDAYPKLLTKVRALFASQMSNCFTMHLCPKKPSHELRIDNPTFSLTRQMPSSQPHEQPSDHFDGFGPRLRSSIAKRIRVQGIDTISATLSDDFCYSLKNPLKIDNTLNVDDRIEKAAMAVQFFLASINIYCYAQGLSKSNFGQEIERCINVIQFESITESLFSETPVELSMFSIIDSLQATLGLSRELTEKDKEAIKQDFMLHYALIKDFEHFDEFMIFREDVPGIFFNHRNRISIPFVDLYSELSDSSEYSTLFDNSKFLKECKLRKLPPHNHIHVSTINGFLPFISEDNFEKPTDFLCAQIKDSNGLMNTLSDAELTALFAHPMWPRMAEMMRTKGAVYVQAIEKAEDHIYKEEYKAILDKKLVSSFGNTFDPVLFSQENYRKMCEEILQHIVRYEKKRTFFSISFKHSDFFLKLLTIYHFIPKPSEEVRCDFLPKLLKQLNSLLEDIPKDKKDSLVNTIDAIKVKIIDLYQLQDSPCVTHWKDPHAQVTLNQDTYLGDLTVHKCLHHLDTDWWSVKGMAVIKRLPKTCYNYVTVKLLNTTNPNLFDELSLIAIKEDGFPRSIDFVVLQERGRFIQLLEDKRCASETRTALLKLHVAWLSDTDGLNRLTDFVGSREVPQELYQQMITGLNFYIQQKLPLLTTTLEMLQDVGGLLQAHPIFNGIKAELSLLEPRSVDYIYIDEHNTVHLLMPIVGGQSIGVDNTCQTAKELQKFWHGTDHSPSALKVLEDYQQKLCADISYLEKTRTYKAAIELKKARKIQIENYITLLRNFKRKLACDSLAYPHLPEYVQKLFNGSERNGFTIHLCPHDKDWALRGKNPTFSLKRPDGPNRLDGLGRHLRVKIEAFLRSNLSDTTSARDMLKKQVFQSFAGDSLKELQEYTQTVILERFGESVDLTNAKIMCMVGDKLSKYFNDDYLQKICGITFGDDSHEDVLDALLNATLDDSFWDKQKKPLEIDKDLTDQRLKVEKAAMAVQFFLASINIYCYAKGLSKSNFGTVIEGLEGSNPLQFNRIVDNIARRFFSGLAVEELIFSEIDELQVELGLSRVLNDEDEKAIIREFEINYNTIKDSPHLDEFIIFREDVAGAFFNHKSRISIPWIDLVAERNDPRISNLAANAKALKSRPLRQLASNNAVVIPSMTDFLASVSEDNYQMPTDFLCAQITNSYDLLVKFNDDELSQLFNHPMWPQMETLMCQSGEIHRQAIDKAISFVIFRENYSKKELTAYSAMLSKKHESTFDTPEEESENSLDQKVNFFSRKEVIRYLQHRLFGADYHPMLHYLKAEWFSPSGIALIQQFPKTCYNYKTMQLLNTLNPAQFDRLSIEAIKNDGFPSSFDVQALQQRGRFILAIGQNKDKVELLKLHASWSSCLENREILAALLATQEELSLEQLAGLKFYFQRQMSLQSLDLAHLQKLGNLLQALPILKKIDYRSVNDAMMRGIQEDIDVETLSERLSSCIETEQQPLLAQLDAAQSRYATHTSSMRFHIWKTSERKNRMIQATLEEAQKLVDHSEVTQALAAIKAVKKRIQNDFEGGADTKWSWFHLKYIVPESGKVLNELITELEKIHEQQTKSPHSP